MREACRSKGDVTRSPSAYVTQLSGEAYITRVAAANSVACEICKYEYVTAVW
jgi:hypothetical protein